MRLWIHVSLTTYSIRIASNVYRPKDIMRRVLHQDNILPQSK